MNSNETGNAPSQDAGDTARQHEPPVGGSPGVWAWYFQNFVGGFCYYLPLLLLFLLPLAILFGSLGADYGPRLLFLHENPIKQFVAGVSLALFWAEVLFVGYLLWLRDCREGRLKTGFNRVPDQQPKTNHFSQPLSFLGYSLRVLSCIGATVLVFVIVVSISGEVFDVFSAPALSSWLDVGGLFKDCFYLLSGVIATVALVGGARLLSPHLKSLGVYLADRLGFSGREMIGEADSSVRESAPRPPATLWVLSALSRLLEWLVNIVRWMSGPLIVAAWIIAFILICRWPPPGSKFYWSVFFVGLGLLLNFTAPFTDLRDGAGPKVQRGSFLVALVSNLILGYAFVSWCISNCPYGLLAGLLCATLWGVLLTFATQQYCRSRWDALLDSWRKPLARLYSREREYVYWGLFLGAVIPIVLLVLAIVPALASPAPLANFLMFGIVAVYAVFTYFVRRTLIVVLGVVVLLALVSHVQPYQMRFPGLAYDHILDLEEQTRTDLARQETFDEYFQKFQQNENELALLDLQISNYRKLINNNDEPQLIAESRSKLDELEQERQNKVVERETLAKNVQNAWQVMERENRVRAGRLDAQRRRENLLLNDKGDAGVPGLLRTKELEVWRPEAAGAKEPEPLVVIAISGGGIRAAVWAFYVLMRLELDFARKEKIDFPSHVRIITGASGGMLGASYYVTTLPSAEKRRPEQPGWIDQREQTLAKQQNRLESSDYLTPLTQRLVFNDIPGWLSPWPAKSDRGQALEEAWNKYLQQDPEAAPGAGKGALNVTFESIREEERKGMRPSLVFAPMMIEDGRRLIVSNLDLRWIISNDGYAIPSKSLTGNGMGVNLGGPQVQQYGVNHSIEALELFRLFPTSQEKLTVATAVRMSASFPYLSPAISLPTTPRRRVVDAGYYDNYGVSLNAAWLLSEENQDWINKNSGRRILFIQIRDGVTERKRQLQEPVLDNSNSTNRSLEELTSPIEGLYNARVSSSSFRNDGQLKLLAQVEKLREPNRSTEIDTKPVEAGLTYTYIPFMVANFECEAEVSLSWYLSSREQRDIDQAAKKIDDKVDKILDWWKNKKVGGQ
jgi:hypothetical protein